MDSDSDYDSDYDSDESYRKARKMLDEIIIAHEKSKEDLKDLVIRFEELKAEVDRLDTLYNTN